MKIAEAVGYKVCVRQPKEKKSEGGILFAEEVTYRRAKVELEVEVVSIGNLAFKDLGDGTPWCEVGDKVIIKPIVGDIVDDEEYRYRYINDTDIIATKEKKPYGKNILVSLYKEEDNSDIQKVKNTIILENSENQIWKIEEIGPNVFEDTDPYLKVGDTVRIDRFAGFNKGEEHRFIRLKEVIGVYK